MDNYTYNPWFLPTWMEKNHIKKAHLLRVLGLIGKANLDVWLGQSKKQREDAAKGIKVVPPPIPLHHIATICNHYHIDIRNFFVMPGTDFADENGHDNDETPAASPLPVAATTPDGSATTPAGSPAGSPSVPPFPEGEVLLDAAIFIQGEKGDKGDKGDPGSDADVTAENIERALDGTPLLSITTEQLNAIFD